MKFYKAVLPSVGLLGLGIKNTKASLASFIEHHDTDTSGGLTIEEVQPFLDLIGSSATGCQNATSFAAIWGANAEISSREDVTEFLLEASDCLESVRCGTTFEVEVAEEIYECALETEEEEHEHEEEEGHDHEEHAEEELHLTFGTTSMHCVPHEHEEEGNDTFTNATWLRTLGATLFTALLSLAGVFFIIFGLDPVKTKTHELFLDDAIAFAAGILLFLAFAHILPEGVEALGGDLEFGYWLILGICITSLVEFTWPLVAGLFFGASATHMHDLDGDVAAANPAFDDEEAKKVEKDAAGTEATVSHKTNGAIIANICIGDFLHNFIDGVIIALAFGVCNSVTLGVSVTLGIVAHELPQELSDFIVLVKAGLSYKNALLLNLLSSSSALLGALILLGVGDLDAVTQGRMLVVSAGILAFIVLSELYPMMTASIKDNKTMVKRLFFLGLGITLGVLMSEFIPHEHCEIGHDHAGHDH